MNKYILLLIMTTSSVESYIPHQVDLLKKYLSQKIVPNCSGCDFRGAGVALQGINFSGLQLSGATFAINKSKHIVPGLVNVVGQKTTLKGVSFAGAILISTDFAGAQLQGADFTGADIRYANFTGANLTGAKFDKTLNSDTAVFCNAIMPNGEIMKGSSWTSPTGETFLAHCPKKK